MKRKSFALGALLNTYGTVARAAAQDIVPISPSRNLSNPIAGATDSNCAPKCSVYYPSLSALQWIPESQIMYTTKVTVGTVSYVIVTESSRILETRTQTIYGYVPPEYDLYRQSKDEAGTAVVNVPLTVSDGVLFTQFTYPTPYVEYFTEYHWEGVLPTQDKESSPVCATATPEPANVPLSKHPEYPQPKAANPSEDDPSGQNHQPIWVSINDESENAFFDATFPSESAFTYCSSVSRSTPMPTQFSAPKFVFDSTTIYSTPTTQGIIVIQSSATGWEEITSDRRHSIAIPHEESTAPGFDETLRPYRPTDGVNSIEEIPSSAAGRYESTATGFEVWPPEALQTGSPDTPNNNGPPSPLDAVSTRGNNIPQDFSLPSENPTVVPTRAGSFAGAVPVFTFVPTVIDGQSTTIPAFIIPGTSVTATIGQIINIDGQPTTLAAPPAILTMVPTTINGIATSSYAYIISGSVTATIGQTVTLRDQPTVLSVPPAYFTRISTTIDGVATTIPAYIISGSRTATIGQTVTIDGTTTVLSIPTNSAGVYTGFVGPVPSITSQAEPTGGGSSSQGAAKEVRVMWVTVFIGIGFIVELLL